MTPDRWKKIEELYQSAVDKGKEEREALLAQADPEVRDTVIEMLRQGSSGNILDRPAWDGVPEFLDTAIAPLEPGVRLGPYRIDGVLGTGGMGAVYRAFDSRLNRSVAIKILPPALAGDPERLRRFEQEARAAGTLNHPNILTIYDVGSHDGISYLVSELLEGETLRDRLRGGPLPRPKALEHARLIAAGLSAAHERGITHRDLKPENLFLLRDGRFKILDFGLAKFTAPEGNTILTAPPTEGASRTFPTLLMGTIGYMSPEQVQGLPIDTRSDIFNAGIVILEMVTGQRPFLGATPLETLQDVLHKEPQLSDLPGMDSALARVIRRCLEKDPGNRFQSAEELRVELEALDAPSPERLSRRQFAWYAGGGIAAAAGLAWLKSRAVTPSPVPHPLTSRTHGNITTARFTPDGRTIVFSAARNGKPLETFKMSATGGEPIPLGIPLAGIASISAKDELALMLDCELNWGECRGTLATRPLAGGEPTEIDEIPGKVEYADWGPDGELAIVRRRRSGSIGIEYPMGNELYANPTGWISHLRVSPKGDRLAFLNHPERDTDFASVEVVDLNGVRTTLVSASQGVKGLAWTPVGDEVWFSGTGEIQELRAVSLDKRERIVRSLSGWFELLDIARDGRVLMMQQQPADWIVFEPQRARQSPFNDTRVVDLSSDGNRVLIRAGRNTRLFDTETGESKQLGEGKALALSRDGRWALATRSSPNPELVLFPVKPGEPRRLPRTDVAAYLAGLWVDSNHVIFVGQHADGSVRSYIQSIYGGLAQPIADPDIFVALASPDGAELAAYGRESDTYYRLSISGEPRPPFRGLEPYDELLQWGSDQSLYVRSPEESRIDLVQIDLATGSRKLFKKLVPDPLGFIGIESTRVTPDGSTVVYNYWTALGELYLLDGVL